MNKISRSLFKIAGVNNPIESGFVCFDKFNFARKVSAAKKSNGKTVEVVKEEVPIRITPYFSKAVSEKEKSSANINISELVEAATGKKESFEQKQNKERIKKLKQKLDAAKKQKAGKKIGVIMENIKRELPKEL